MSLFTPGAPAGGGVLFDFNGVLFWDSPLHERAWCALAEYVRGTPFTADELAKVVHGRPNTSSIEYLLGRRATLDELAALSHRKEEMYRRLCRAEGPHTLSSGAASLLDALKATRVPMTIATSAPRSNLDFYIELLSLERWFDLDRIVYDDGTFPGKPAPDPYLRAAVRLGLAPERCTVVEDSISGIESARSAGVGEIIALGPPADHALLGNLPGVRLVVTSLGELEPRLRAMGAPGPLDRARHDWTFP